jgi:hypothetical protein
MQLIARPLAVVLLSACAFSWTTGPTDGAVDDVDGATGGDEASCANIASFLKGDRGLLKSCTMAVGCPGTLTDECGCQFSVSPSTDSIQPSYSQNVAAYHEAGCAGSASGKPCPTPCQAAVHACNIVFCE